MPTSMTELLGVYDKLNASNRFAVLVYARFKVVRQMAQQVYHTERRKHPRVKVMRVHWV